MNPLWMDQFSYFNTTLPNAQRWGPCYHPEFRVIISCSQTLGDHGGLQGVPRVFHNTWTQSHIYCKGKTPTSLYKYILFKAIIAWIGSKYVFHNIFNQYQWNSQNFRDFTARWRSEQAPESGVLTLWQKKMVIRTFFLQQKDRPWKIGFIWFYWWTM